MKNARMVNAPTANRSAVNPTFARRIGSLTATVSASPSGQDGRSARKTRPTIAYSYRKKGG
jgi:hypothetical protein